VVFVKIRVIRPVTICMCPIAQGYVSSWNLQPWFYVAT